ncbi:MAG: GreA/GreB family elongation factor, partial [Deltaproteobacteria bacterium]|nr:GreA/GreB family elongation factor [Deltaproteobacteria bacterium]
IESPIGRSLIGKEIGDEVKVQTPRGTRAFEVLKIRYI